MKKLERAIHEICSMEKQASQNKWINELNALPKLIVTLSYIILLVSFDKYDVWGICSMFVYPVVLFTACDIGFKNCIKRIWITFPLILILGACNPLFDRAVIVTAFGIGISGGVISAFTLFLKGIFAVMAAYLLMITTTIDDICISLRRIHIPEALVTVFLLTYRYINVLLKEANRLMEAYQMRATGEKGIRFGVWGSLVGGLLIRSSCRAYAVYDSMNMRGYEMASYMLSEDNVKNGRQTDVIWAAAWIIILIIFRIFPVFYIIGNIFV